MECLPSEPGVYFATHIASGWRSVALIGKDGFGRIRVFTPRWSRAAKLNEFMDYSKRISDPGPAVPCKRRRNARTP